MITLQAVVRSHKAVRDLWAVARIHVTEGDEGGSLQPGTELAAKGDLLGAAAVGELLRLEGELVVDPKWGKQLHVERQESLGIQSPVEAHRWLERLPGVGPKTAKKLHDHFEGKVLEILRAEPAKGEPDPLLEVVGVPLAKTIRESWGQIGAQGDPETLAYLDGLGLSHYQVNRVLAAAKKRHETPQEFLKTDPYRLVEEKGFGFALADNVALKAGVSREAPARVDAAIEFQIEETCSTDTVAAMGRLIDDVVKLTGVNRELVATGIYRTAAARRGVVITEDAQGCVLVHPTKLLEAERTIHEWAVGPVAPTRKPDGAAQDLAPFQDPPTHVVIDVDPVTAARLADEVTRMTGRDVEVLDLEAVAADVAAPPHHCHARGCSTPVPPRMLMCARHWRMVPQPLKDAVWAYYVPGQEVTKDPTPAYLNAADAAIRAVAEQEGRVAPARAGGITPDEKALRAAFTAEVLERIERQEIACELAGIPCFAPPDGVCFACHRQIYELVDGSTPIGGCPACARSYCD